MQISLTAFSLVRFLDYLLNRKGLAVSLYRLILCVDDDAMQVYLQ